MNCLKFQSQLPEYAIGRLSANAMAQMSAHINQCPACAQELQVEQALRRLTVASPMQRETPDVSLRLGGQLATRRQRLSLPKLWLYSSGLAATGAFAVLLFVQTSLPTPQTMPVAQSPAPVRVTFASMVSEAQNIGVAETDLLVQETHPGDLTEPRNSEDEKLTP